MFDVAPGLFVERVEGGKKMALKAICRPTVLVHSGHEEPKQSPTTGCGKVREAPRARQLKELGLRRVSSRAPFDGFTSSDLDPSESSAGVSSGSKRR